MSRVKIEKKERKGRINIPTSKSDGQRSLLAAALVK